MQSFSIRDLRERTRAFRRETEKGNLALVTRHGHPLFITLPFTENLLQHGIHTALAENLYKNGVMTLGKAAKLAGLSIVDFTEHLSQAGIPVVDYPVDELADELKYFNS